MATVEQLSSNLVLPHAHPIAVRARSGVLRRPGRAGANLFRLTEGVGFVFRRVVTLRPALSVAIGTGEADPILSLSLARNFRSASADR